MKVSTLIESFVVVLVFGVGTDYTIFLISRYREELARTPDGGRSAASRAVAAERTVGPDRRGHRGLGGDGHRRPRLARGRPLRPGPDDRAGDGARDRRDPGRRASRWPPPSSSSSAPRSSGRATRSRSARRPASSAWDRLAAGIVRRPILVAPRSSSRSWRSRRFVIPAPTTSFDMLAELPTTSDARVGFERVAEHMDRGRLMPIVTYLDAPDADLTTPGRPGRDRRRRPRRSRRPRASPASGASSPRPGRGSPTTSTRRAQLRTIAGEVGLLAHARARSTSSSPTRPTWRACRTGGAWLDALGAGHPWVAADPSWADATDARTAPGRGARRR